MLGMTVQRRPKWGISGLARGVVASGVLAACVVGGNDGSEDGEPVGHVPARRLTSNEYNNTVRDLFGFDVGRPADAFPADSEGANGLTVSDLYLETSLQAAERLSALAIERGFIQCDPTRVEPRTCARQTLEPFLKRAWRRPIADAEIESMLGFLSVGAAGAGETKPFEAGIRLAIQSALLSPHFMFRMENLADPLAPDEQPLGPYEVASRLSYFIYESMPDDALFAAADADALRSPAALEAQVFRMLEDPKGEAFVRKLVGKWLALDTLDLLRLDTAVYPAFTDSRRNTIYRETSLFVKEFIASDRDLRDMLHADFTYLNAQLANDSGLPTDGLGTEHTRVSLPSGSVRGGLLTQAAVLAASTIPANDSTAPIRETGVIFRGHYVLGHILCANPGAPPDGLDVNAIQNDAEKNIPRDAPRKVREAVRLTNQACLGCHQYIDPIGYSMEHFDVIGRWRDRDLAGGIVDSSGTLTATSGQPLGMFDGARSLGALLKEDPRVTSCLTQTMLKDALGRKLNDDDKARAERLAAKSLAEGSRLRRLIISLILDKAFTHQQGEAL